MQDRVLGRYDGPTLRRLFDDAGILEVLRQKGFTDLEVVVDALGRALPHVLLQGSKHGERFLLLDGCIGEAVVRPAFFAQRGHSMPQPIDLAVVHWVREEDPTVSFAADRPALPLQDHPGLGILRRAFQVIARIAGELKMDGVASVPKFFHDAVIFYHSRLFLFLDGEEQGRFEALVRDLSTLDLRDASLAILTRLVRDDGGAVVNWVPGYQVFPLSSQLTAYFHAPEYAARVARAVAGWHFTVDLGAAAARAHGRSPA